MATSIIPLILFAVAVVVTVIIRLFAGGLDGDRVGDYIRGQGGELLDSKWSPFGRGWFGEKNDRIYEVRYRDRSGNVHEATVKTSMLSGVYFTEDRIVAPAVAKPTSQSESTEDQPELEVAELERENERLRARIAELEDRDNP